MTEVMSIKSRYISTDVICVKFYRNFVLAGLGGLLKIYDVSSCKCVKEVEIFKGHKVYGIQPGRENKILVFGCKTVRIFEFSDSNLELSLSCIKSLTLKDWILSAHWLSDGNQIILVTAHNVAWLWPWLESDTLFLKHATCSEKCILYSATVCGKDWTDCVIFAGTVFREVVIWLPGGHSEGDQPILHRLGGHNGVIFSLTWDWHSFSLCSTSDDRSVRLWNISLLDKSDWRSSSIMCSHVFYGHSARVWRSIILENLVVSVGEDCQICMWSMEGKLLQTLERSTSGCQWSLDYSKKHQLLVTGAGDGSIQLLPLKLPLSAPNVPCVSSLETISQPNVPSVRKIILLHTGCIVALTEDGTMLQGNPHAPSSWKVVCKDDRFSNYFILSVAPNRMTYSLASLRGLVVLYQGALCDESSQTMEQQLEEGKIWSLVWLSNDEILVCGDEGRLCAWHIPPKPGMDFTCIGRFRLPRARERWATCATFVKTDSKKFIICGDRCGSLHLFGTNCLSDEEYLAPDHSLPRLHGKLGVTSVFVSGNKIFSTGRDGTVRILRVDQKPAQLSVLCTTKMTVEWVHAVISLPSDPKSYLIIGFKETNMVVWSTEERRIILQFDCGGGHRSWDCIMSDKDKLGIAYVREKRVYFSTWTLEDLMMPMLLAGVSPRGLNCVSAYCNSISELLFGGEDGSIYVCKFSDNLSSLRSKITLTSHISSVRCMCFHGKMFFSAGGRAQLKAWQIEMGSGDEISCVELASHMMKGERNPRSPPSIYPEMRYMSLCSIPSMGNCGSIVWLIAGYSDGAMRWLTFDSTNRTFQVVGESMFHGKCVLKLLAVPLENGKVVLVSTATDGRIALWDIVPEMFVTSSNTWQPFWSSHFHQCGVNSISIKILPATSGTVLLLASGGDDNSIVLKALQLNDLDVSVLSNWSSSSAHAAQITGVSLVGEWLISTSIDQRLTVWHWNQPRDEATAITCDFVEQIICSVPDIQDMHIWQREDLLYVCVVGKGIQVLSISLLKLCKKTC